MSTRLISSTPRCPGFVDGRGLAHGRRAQTLRRRTLTLLLASITLTPLAGCGDRDPGPPPPVAKTSNKEDTAAVPTVAFTDVTATSGVQSSYDNGEAGLQRSIVESLGGGVGMFDFDLDGLWDLYFPGGGSLPPGEPLPGLPSTLWRNQGDLQFTNSSDSSGSANVRHYTHGCAMGDYDADGFDDILVTGYGGLTLFRNQGDGTFQDVTKMAELNSQQWSSSAAWADLNGDGHLDLFVTNYVDWSWDKNPQCFANENKREICSPQDFSPLTDLIYFNNGNGTFRAADQEAGITEAGKGLGALALDANRDGAVDVYVANDTTKNLLFVNDGLGNFTEAGLVRGTAYDERGISNGSMGVAVLDYNNDAQPDIWVTNYENETFALYHNDSDGMFRCLTEATGITALGTLYVGFGTVAADFTCNGYEDIVVANGHVMMYPVYSEIQQAALYLQNDGRGHLSRLDFTDDSSYFATKHRGRGVVAGDLDRDGKLDLVFSHVNEPATILRQTSPLDGQSLELKLIGRSANRNAVGASLVLETDARSLFRTIVGGGSYLSQSPYIVHFGIPSGESIRKLTIYWPGGDTQVITDLTPGQRYAILQDQTQPTAL